ncbi:hypothetical protein P691DRAFT_779454 [Macrolepiota fuliginosa MF-IS2]|uniref:SMAD/FHA domain-containing protein n=1 Tax=Macrolepiota fuliginosa MF-IS2 TaxID=1400762 RepID=A0A9P5X060_9AGAR|nr:hypothetical protein P691DRAFT_779454 [Macrolepiota fuliginosa MF-IS2]
MESESSPARTTILDSFLRGRPGNSSQSEHPRELYPPPAHPPSPALQASRASRRNNASSPNQRSLRFGPISRDLRNGDPVLRIVRFADRSGLGLSAINSLNSNKLAFRSKVVSRAHAEIWVEGGGKFYIRDTKSSSGTFLNHVRLSAANMESRPFQIKDGDILQLGVDYQGGAEDYKSVKVEIGRDTTAFKNLKALAGPVHNTAGVPNAGKIKALGIPDCCICLFSMTARQALFIAPCSHTFHYKSIRPILEAHPAFSCLLCRTYVDLEEDVEVDEGSGKIDVSWEDGEGKDNKYPTPIPSGAEDDGDNDGPGIISSGEGDDDRMDVDQGPVVRPEVVLEEPEPDEGGLARVEEFLWCLAEVALPSDFYNHKISVDAVFVDLEDAASPPLIPLLSFSLSSSFRHYFFRFLIFLAPKAQSLTYPHSQSLGNTHHEPIQLSPPPDGASSGSEDIDSDIAAAAASTNSHLPSITVSNPTSTITAMQWGSPGAGSSASARGDPPIPLNLGVPGQVAVGVGGTGGDDAKLGLVVDAGIVGMDGDTVSGKRKR